MNSTPITDPNSSVILFLFIHLYSSLLLQRTRCRTLTHSSDYEADQSTSDHDLTGAETEEDNAIQAFYDHPEDEPHDDNDREESFLDSDRDGSVWESDLEETKDNTDWSENELSENWHAPPEQLLEERHVLPQDDSKEINDLLEKPNHSQAHLLDEPMALANPLFAEKIRKIVEPLLRRVKDTPYKDLCCPPNALMTTVFHFRASRVDIEFAIKVLVSSVDRETQDLIVSANEDPREWLKLKEIDGDQRRGVYSDVVTGPELGLYVGSTTISLDSRTKRHLKEIEEGRNDSEHLKLFHRRGSWTPNFRKLAAFEPPLDAAFWIRFSETVWMNLLDSYETREPLGKLTPTITRDCETG